MSKLRASGRPGVAACVIASLALLAGVSLAEFSAVENRVSSTWQALRPGDHSAVHPDSPEFRRYALFLTLADEAPGAEIVMAERTGGNLRGRLLGMARLSSLRVVEFDQSAVAAAALASGAKTLSGPTADGDATFYVVVESDQPQSMVFARVGNGDIVVADIEVLPSALARELGP